MEALRVSGSSNPNSLAGAISYFVRRDQSIELQAIGAASVNQAIKAIAIARGFVSSSGKNLITIPSFVDVKIDNERRTAIKFLIKHSDQYLNFI